MPNPNPGTLPVALFAFRRPEHLRRTLACLRADRVPLLYAFCDGTRSQADDARVAEVRAVLRAVDWCEVVLVERQDNIGLGRSVLEGVGHVLAQHPAVVVYEDDLVSVPGAYAYLCAALEHYHADERVMSVTGWTHPRVTPADVVDTPYFDGRAECWVWGTWRRAWQGMEQDALAHVQTCLSRGIDIHRYGADLLPMAEAEHKSNIWAVRWLYHHIANRGLCLRPPHSLVEHIGFDERATNAADGLQWTNPPLRACPPLPAVWPEPVEHPQCAPLWRRAFGRATRLRLGLRRTLRRASQWLTR